MDRRHAPLALAVLVALCVWAVWPGGSGRGTTAIVHTASRPSRTAADHRHATTRPTVDATALASSSAPTASWVEKENRKPGTREWAITNAGATHAIEGYADQVSVQQGDTVRLFVSTTAPAFDVEAYRMGYYQGLGGRLVWRSAQQQGVKQPDPVVVPRVNMVETHWQPSLSVTVDKTWPPGEYLFKLVASTGAQRYIPLTVRDDASHAAYLIQSSVATWQAYNMWGGYDLYLGGPPSHPSFAQRARIVSFDRPYDHDGASEFVGNELPLVWLAESKGLDVTYWTDVDLHRAPQLVLQHRVLVTLGHDEYWSTSMRAGAENARDHGVNLVFLGANAVFRHIRFEPSTLGPDRHVVDYKSASEDPTTDKSEVTVDWRAPPLDHPESTLLGGEYECNPVDADMVVLDASQWEFAGTGLRNGAHLPHLVGSEYDRYNPNLPGPKNVTVLTHSPVRCQRRPSYADMTYYTAPSGAGVFDTGTSIWVANLTGPCPQGGCLHNDAVVTVTWNVLEAFGRGPAGLQHPSVSNAQQLPNGGAPLPGEVSNPRGGRVSSGE